MHTLREESWAYEWFAQLLHRSVGGRNYAAEAVRSVASPGAIGWFRGLSGHDGRPFYGTPESVGYIHIAHAIKEDVKLNTYDDLRTILGVLRALALAGKSYINGAGNDVPVWGYTEFAGLRHASRRDVETVLKDIPAWSGLTLQELEDRLDALYTIQSVEKYGA